MFSRLLLRAALPLLVCCGAPIAAQDAPISQADLRRHIEMLASDAFQGRAPATEGERLSTGYIIDQLRRRGIEPAGDNGGWLQAVPLVERATRNETAAWTANGRPLDFDANEIALQGRETQEAVRDAPVLFAGHGARMPEHGIDQIEGADVRGAVVLILVDAPQVPGFPSLADRVKAMTDAGAAAVIALTDIDLPWQFVRENYRRPATRLASQGVPLIIGAMPLSAAQRLVEAAGGDFERLFNEQTGPGFRAVTLPLRASLNVTTQVNSYSTHNVVGRIRGSGAGGLGESILLMAHWDHFGTCRPEGEPDRICNGAVDNASGVAELIEVAGRIAAGPRPTRDVIVLATTAEENGLLGAAWFAAHPPVPLARIVAGINMEMPGIAPAGAPVTVIGRGYPPLDNVVGQAIVAAGRTIDASGATQGYAQHQDGWALASAGVPTVLIGGGFSDAERLNAYLENRYHSPADAADASLELGGAAEDANLIVDIARRLADPAIYQRSQAETDQQGAHP
jgi:hypothetical protein